MANLSSPNPIFIRLKQAARLLDVNHETLRRWIADDKGPPVHKIGRNIRIRSTDFEAWLESRKRTV